MEALVADSVTQRPCCSFCWQGAPTPKVPNHAPTDCQLLTKFNEKRTSKQFQPITLARNAVEVNSAKQPIGTDELAERLAKLEADFAEKMATMDRRLKSMEKGPKRKAEDSTTVDTRPSKKQKRLPNPATGEAEARPPKKGSKRGKGTKAKNASQA
jgi:hypothetical protein